MVDEGAVDAVVTGISLSVRDVTVRERRKRELAEGLQRLAAVEERFGEVTVLALRQVSRPEAAAERLPPVLADELRPPARRGPDGLRCRLRRPAPRADGRGDRRLGGHLGGDRLPAPPQWPATGLRRRLKRGILDGLSRPGSPGVEAPEIRVVPELGESSSRLPTEFRPNRDSFSKITKAVLELGSGEA